MALFKVLRGNETSLPATKTDGWAYFCSDTGNFYIDHQSNAGSLTRTQLNAKYASQIKYKDGNGYIEISGADLNNAVLHISNKSNPHNVTKEQIGLDQVDNTPDANKNVASAVKATKDASGNTITDTYETKLDASNKLIESKLYADEVIKSKAEKVHDHNDQYYTEAEIDGMVFITTADIDTICNASIQSVNLHSEVTF